MSVSASEVNGSSGCYSVRGCLVFKVLHLVPVVLAVLVDRSKFSFFFCSFRGYLGYLSLGHVLFCESRGSFSELLWFSCYLWSSWFFSSNHGPLGSPVLVVPVLLLAIMDIMVSSLFLVVRVVLLLHSSSSLFSMFVWSSRFLQSLVVPVWFFGLGFGDCLSWFHENHGKQKNTRFTSMQNEKNENQKK